MQKGLRFWKTMRWFIADVNFIQENQEPYFKNDELSHCRKKEEGFQKLIPITANQKIWSPQLLVGADPDIIDLNSGSVLDSCLSNLISWMEFPVLEIIILNAEIWAFTVDEVFLDYEFWFLAIDIRTCFRYDLWWLRINLGWNVHSWTLDLAFCFGILCCLFFIMMLALNLNFDSDFLWFPCCKVCPLNLEPFFAIAFWWSRSPFLIFCVNCHSILNNVFLW